jgi:PAS domain S-box-containing protein
VWIGSRQELLERYPAVARDGASRSFGAFAALPLVSGKRVLGAVGVEFSDAREWDEDDQRFLRAIARQGAQAIDQLDLRGSGAQTRAELVRSERRYRSLVESTSAIHWTVDPAGAFVEPQPSWEAYTGQPWEQHRGFGWLDAMHPDDREKVMARWVAARDTGGLYVSETRLWHAGTGDHRHTISRAAPVRDEDDHIVEWVGTITDVHEQRLEEEATIERETTARGELEAASERLAYLAAASTVLASSLDVDATLQRLAELAVPRLADWCTVDMLDDDGSVDLVAVAHVDPKKIELAHDLRRRYPPDLDLESGLPLVLRSGRSLIMEEIPQELLEQAKEQNPELADLVDELQLKSVMIVPVSLGDRVLGAISFVWAESGLRYDRHDLALAEDLAHRAAVAIENARLYEAERAARREETRAHERFRVLADAGAAMASTLDERHIVEALTRIAARHVADVAVVYLLDRSGEVIDFVAAHRDPAIEATVRRATSLRFPTAQDEHSAVARVLRSNERVLVPRITDRHVADAELTDEQRELIRRVDPRSEIAVPIEGRGRPIGVLAMLRTETSPAFDEVDLQLASDLARRTAILMENARLYAERDEVAETLQRSLLPPEPVDVPGLDIGARYLPAQEGLTVGGDFYDVFELDLDRWGAVIGDVVGKGAPAAAMMGLARYTIRTAALAENRPSALLATLNDAMMRQTRDSMFCTACFARVRRQDDRFRVTLASGGHPLPLLLRADGSLDLVGEPGTLIGIFEDPTLVDRSIDLEPGDALVLYTDGVTDERREGEEFGEGRLRNTVASLVGRDAQAIADGVVDAVADFRSGTAHDDIALLVIRVRP